MIFLTKSKCFTWTSCRRTLYWFFMKACPTNKGSLIIFCVCDLPGLLINCRYYPVEAQFGYIWWSSGYKKYKNYYFFRTCPLAWIWVLIHNVLNLNNKNIFCRNTSTIGMIWLINIYWMHWLAVCLPILSVWYHKGFYIKHESVTVS